MPIDKNDFYNADIARNDTKKAADDIQTQEFYDKMDKYRPEIDKIMEYIKHAVERGEYSVTIHPATVDEYERYAANNKVIPEDKAHWGFNYRMAFQLLRTLGYRVSTSTLPVVLENDNAMTPEEMQQKSRPIDQTTISWEYAA